VREALQSGPLGLPPAAGDRPHHGERGALAVRQPAVHGTLMAKRVTVPVSDSELVAPIYFAARDSLPGRERASEAAAVRAAG